MIPFLSIFGYVQFFVHPISSQTTGFDTEPIIGGKNLPVDSQTNRLLCLDSSQVAISFKKRGQLTSLMGRPAKGALSSFDQDLVHYIEQLRKKEGSYGPDYLLSKLKRHPLYGKRQLPSRSSIAIFLREKGYTKPYTSHSDLPIRALKSVDWVHQRWQLDAKGNEEVSGIGTIGLLNIKDVKSLLFVMTFPAFLSKSSSHAKTSDYQCALRLGFMERGRPWEIQTDHESILFDNKSKSPLPTILHLWLLDLDIQLLYSRFHQPIDQAIVERSHRTMQTKVLKDKHYTNWASLSMNVKKRVTISTNTLVASRLEIFLPMKNFLKLGIVLDCIAQS